MTLSLSLTIAAAVLAGACATTNTGPSEQSASSSASIRAAEEVGATRTPDAALHLQLAKEQFEYASTVTNPKEKDRANRLLMRAEVDAELALALARSEDEKGEARKAIDKVKALKASAAP